MVCVCVCWGWGWGVGSVGGSLLSPTLCLKNGWVSGGLAGKPFG